jgi:hypothetical protein
VPRHLRRLWLAREGPTPAAEVPAPSPPEQSAGAHRQGQPAARTDHAAAAAGPTCNTGPSTAARGFELRAKVEDPIGRLDGTDGETVQIEPRRKIVHERSGWCHRGPWPADHDAHVCTGSAGDAIDRTLPGPPPKLAMFLLHPLQRGQRIQRAPVCVTDPERRQAPTGAIG